MYSIYIIQNKVNDKIYVGETKRSPYTRWVEHKRSLRKGSHCNSYLQRAWDKYGEENFEFYLVFNDELTLDETNFLEEFYRVWFKEIGLVYNVKDCGKSGSHAEETKKKISETLIRERRGTDFIHPWKGKHHTKETREKISVSVKRLVQSKEKGQKITAAKTGMYCGGKLYEAFGESKTISQWVKDSRCIVNRGTLHSRLKWGWKVEESLITPPLINRKK